MVKFEDFFTELKRRNVIEADVDSREEISRRKAEGVLHHSRSAAFEL